jgi:hypothetical protein
VLVVLLVLLLVEPAAVQHGHPCCRRDNCFVVLVGRSVSGGLGISSSVRFCYCAGTGRCRRRGQPFTDMISGRYGFRFTENYGAVESALRDLEDAR